VENHIKQQASLVQIANRQLLKIYPLQA